MDLQEVLWVSVGCCSVAVLVAMQIVLLGVFVDIQVVLMVF